MFLFLNNVSLKGGEKNESTQLFVEHLLCALQGAKHLTLAHHKPVKQALLSSPFYR